MKFLQWSPKMSVGIIEIDHQHEELFGIINTAAMLKRKGASGESARLVVMRILEFSRYHFTTEESYFERFSYPFAEEHIEEHTKLLAAAAGFYDRFQAGEDVVDELLLFLKGWIDNHLLKHDMKYARFFKKLGIAK